MNPSIYFIYPTVLSKKILSFCQNDKSVPIVRPKQLGKSSHFAVSQVTKYIYIVNKLLVEINLLTVKCKINVLCTLYSAALYECFKVGSLKLLSVIFVRSHVV